jgi:hypothetical protein
MARSVSGLRAPASTVAISKRSSRRAAEPEAAQVERLGLSLSQAANGAFGIPNILAAAQSVGSWRARLPATATHF